MDVDILALGRDIREARVRRAVVRRCNGSHYGMLFHCLILLCVVVIVVPGPGRNRRVSALLGLDLQFVRWFPLFRFGGQGGLSHEYLVRPVPRRSL